MFILGNKEWRFFNVFFIGLVVVIDNVWILIGILKYLIVLDEGGDIVEVEGVFFLNGKFFFGFVIVFLLYE